MGKNHISDEIIFTIAQAKASADTRLQETPAEKFERNFGEILQEEIAMGYSAADSFKHLLHGANIYTYTHPFPLAIYEALSEDTISKLELSDIYFSKNKELNTATIRIIFHFE